MTADTYARLRTMLLDEGMAATRAMLDEDRHPHAERIMARLEGRLQRLDMRDAIRELAALPDCEARAVWRRKVTAAIRSAVADLRPN